MNVAHTYATASGGRSGQRRCIMPQAAVNSLNALNDALNALNSLEVAINLVREHLRDLQREADGYTIVLDRQGKVERILYSPTGEEEWPADDSEGSHISLRSNCEWLIKHIDALWEAHRIADQVLGQLPQRLIEKLDALTSSPWLASARRNCLDVILKWPGEKSHQTSYAATKVHGNVNELLKLALERDPFPTWMKYEELIAGYRHDLFAIRDVAQVPEATPSVAPAESPSAIRDTPRLRAALSRLKDLFPSADEKLDKLQEFMDEEDELDDGLPASDGHLLTEFSVSFWVDLLTTEFKAIKGYLIEVGLGPDAEAAAAVVATLAQDWKGYLKSRTLACEDKPLDSKMCMIDGTPYTPGQVLHDLRLLLRLSQMQVSEELKRLEATVRSFADIDAQPATTLAAQKAAVAQTDQAGASARKIFPKGVPEDSDIRDLALLIDTAKGGSKSLNKIALEFTSGDKIRARSLLAILNRLKREGRYVR